MSEYEYEKVEGMPLGRVVDAALMGGQFYTKKGSIVNFEDIDIFTLNNWLKRGCIYIRKERPWWGGCEGSVIMVRDNETMEWRADTFEEKSDCWFKCNFGNWSQARPLTAEERNAIKVQD